LVCKTKANTENSPDFEPPQEGTPASPDSRDLANYEDYIRRELPILVRSNIEEIVHRELQPLEASLIGSLVGIIQDCQDRVFRVYRETQGMDIEIGMPPSISIENSFSFTPHTPNDEAYSNATEGQPLDQKSEFLDATFQPPASRGSGSIFPEILENENQNGLIRSSGDMVTSDSGYATEQLQTCDSFGQDNFGTADNPQRQHSDSDDVSESQEFEHEITLWNDWGSYLSWNPENI
jgi:hypothetical protein